MTLIEKVDYLNLEEVERKKVINLFLQDLYLISEKELEERVSFLKSKGVAITKAGELKVLTISLEELSKKFSILDEIHETDIYKQGPTLLCRNVIDIYKKIMFCIQAGKSYKREDGTYESFLFSEMAWKNEFNKEVEKNEGDLGYFESVLDVASINESTTEEKILEEPIIDNKPSEDKELYTIPIIESDSMVQDDFKDIDEKTTNFAALREDLKTQLAQLDLQRTEQQSGEMNFDDNVINFMDIQPDVYDDVRRGGRAA